MNTSSSDAEHLKRVRDKFEARQKAFVKQFTILGTFVFAFVAFVLAPTATLTLGNDQLAGEIAAKDKAIDGLNVRLEDLAGQLAALGEERDSINGKLDSLQTIKMHNEIEAEKVGAELAAAADEAGTIRAQMDQNKRQLARLQEISAAMRDVLASFDAGTRTASLHQWFSDIQGAGDPGPACAGAPQLYTCLVREKLHADWDADFGRIREKIIAPIHEISPGEAAALDARIVEVRQGFETRLDSDPDFWHTVDEKRDLMDVLADELARAFAEIGTSVDRWVKKFENQARDLAADIRRQSDKLAQAEGSAAKIKAQGDEIAGEIKAGFAKADRLDRQIVELERQSGQLTAQVGQAEAEKTALQADAAALQAERAEIEQRLTKIQSPFGGLPIGLKEATLAFPVILAIGFAICASLLAELVRLRREYARGEGAGEGGQVAEALLVPLWLEPAVAGRPGVLAWAMLLAPGVIFAAAIVQILWGVSLQAEDPLPDRYLRYFYYVLYAACAVAILAWAARVIGRWAGDAPAAPGRPAAAAPAPAE